MGSIDNLAFSNKLAQQLLEIDTSCRAKVWRQSLKLFSHIGDNHATASGGETTSKATLCLSAIAASPEARRYPPFDDSPRGYGSKAKIAEHIDACVLSEAAGAKIDEPAK